MSCSITGPCSAGLRGRVGRQGQVDFLLQVERRGPLVREDLRTQAVFKILSDRRTNRAEHHPPLKIRPTIPPAPTVPVLPIRATRKETRAQIRQDLRIPAISHLTQARATARQVRAPAAPGRTGRYSVAALLSELPARTKKTRRSMSSTKRTTTPTGTLSMIVELGSRRPADRAVAAPHHSRRWHRTANRRARYRTTARRGTWTGTGELWPVWFRPIGWFWPVKPQPSKPAGPRIRRESPRTTKSQ